MIIRPLTIMAPRPTPPGPPVPEDGVLIGNQIWSKFYVDQNFCGVAPKKIKTYHNLNISYYEISQLSSLTFPNNWRLPTRDDINILRTYAGYIDGGKKLISVEDGGTDVYGLNLYITGYLTGTYYNTVMFRNGAAFARNGLYVAYATTTGGNPTSSSIDEWRETASKIATPFRLILNI